MKGPGGRSTPCDAMDAAPGLLGTPPPEVLEDVLREQFGPLPQLAAICRLKRLPSGGYSSTEDLQLVLERRRVANAKERERVSALPRAGPQGHLGSTALRPCPGTGTNSSLLPPSPIPPSPCPLPTAEHLVRIPCTHSPPTGGTWSRLRPPEGGLVF